jgi:hypothetical protein
MKEPYKEGVANHLDPESCVGVRKDAGEALTGAPAGQPLSSEIYCSSVPTAYLCGEGNMRDDVTREPPLDAAESKTLCMHENSLRENREAPSTSLPMAAGTGRRSHKRTSDVYVPGESDSSIVPAKRANKADSSAAESVEGRGLTKGNVDLGLHAPDTAPGPGLAPVTHDIAGAGIRAAVSRSRHDLRWSTQGRSRMR